MNNSKSARRFTLIAAVVLVFNIGSAGAAVHSGMTKTEGITQSRGGSGNAGSLGGILAEMLGFGR